MIAAALLAPGPETVADEPLRATSVSAFGDYAAWSRWDPSVRRFRLIIRRTGEAAEYAPVRPRKVPFDVDLGPSGAGAPVAVYSRCRREPPKSYEPNPLPEWRSARGCRLFELRLPGGREKRLSLPGSGSAYLPSRWGHRVAFVRRSGRALGRPVLLDLRTRATTVLRGGRRGAEDDPDFRDPGVFALDLKGRRVAMNWGYYGEFCPHPEKGLTKSSALYTEIRVATPDGSARRLAHGCLDVRPSFVLLAGWRGSDVLFARSTFTYGPTYRTTLALRDGRARRPRVDLGPIATDRSNVMSLATAGNRLVSSRQDYDGADFRDRVVESVYARPTRTE